MKQRKTMYSKIFEIINTKEDLESVLGEISLLKNSLFTTGEKSFDFVLNNEVRKSFSERLSEDIKVSRKDKKEYLDGLEYELKKVTEIKLQIAYEPTARNLSIIREWFEKNLGEFVVLDIFYNPAIVGGAKISFKGRYFDGSLSKQVDEELSRLFTKNR